jgi:hypothetical protein
MSSLYYIYNLFNILLIEIINYLFLLVQICDYWNMLIMLFFNFKAAIQVNERIHLVSLSFIRILWLFIIFLFSMLQLAVIFIVSVVSGLL